MHRFTWRVDDVRSLDGQINPDGEVEAHIQALLADDYSKPMSLDDLLANQDDQKSSKR